MILNIRVVWVAVALICVLAELTTRLDYYPLSLYFLSVVSWPPRRYSQWNSRLGAVDLGHAQRFAYTFASYRNTVHAGTAYIESIRNYDLTEVRIEDVLDEETIRELWPKAQLIDLGELAEEGPRRDRGLCSCASIPRSAPGSPHSHAV